MSAAPEEARWMAARPLSHRPGAQGEGAGLKNTLSSHLISKPSGSVGSAERLLLLLSPSASCLGAAPVLFCPARDTTLFAVLCMVQPHRPA